MPTVIEKEVILVIHNNSRQKPLGINSRIKITVPKLAEALLKLTVMYWTDAEHMAILL